MWLGHLYSYFPGRQCKRVSSCCKHSAQCLVLGAFSTHIAVIAQSLRHCSRSPWSQAFYPMAAYRSVDYGVCMRSIWLAMSGICHQSKLCAVVQKKWFTMLRRLQFYIQGLVSSLTQGENNLKKIKCASHIQWWNLPTWQSDFLDSKCWSPC